MVSVRLLEQLAMWSCSLIRLNEKNVSWLERRFSDTDMSQTECGIFSSDKPAKNMGMLVGRHR